MGSGWNSSDSFVVMFFRRFWKHFFHVWSCIQRWNKLKVSSCLRALWQVSKHFWNCSLILTCQIDSIFCLSCSLLLKRRYPWDFFCPFVRAVDDAVSTSDQAEVTERGSGVILLSFTGKRLGSNHTLCRERFVWFIGTVCLVCRKKLIYWVCGSRIRKYCPVQLFTASYFWGKKAKLTFSYNDAMV